MVVQSRPALGFSAVAIVAAMCGAPLFTGYFEFGAWAPIALGSMVLLAMVLPFRERLATRHVLGAGLGLGLLLALAAASMLWAESKESAWTAVNRLALYCAVFVIVLVGARSRRAGRLIVLLMGSAALLTSLWLCGRMLLGTAQGAFLTRRLDSPIGYINGTAGLLMMGMWPWIALSETATRRAVRAAGLWGAAVIAGTLVLTQTRAIIPALAVSSALVLACSGDRARRALILLLVLASAIATLPWTLAVYSGGAEFAAPSGSLLRAAAVAILLGATGAGLARLALSCLARRLDADRRRRGLRLAGTALIAAGAAALVVVSALGSAWLQRQYREFTALQVNEQASIRFIDASGYRYDLWRVAVDEFRAHPVAGVGAGNYDVSYDRLRRTTAYVLEPHSLELQMAAELGVGGVLALLLFCGAVIAAACARAGTLASGDRLIKVAAAGTFAAWLAATSIDWLYDIPGLAGMAFAAAALLVAPAPSNSGAERPARRNPVLTGLSLGLVALLAASLGREYVATRYAQDGAALVSASPAAAIGPLKQSLALDPYALSTLYNLAAAFAGEADYVDARAAIALAVSREPRNYVPRALLGDLAVRHGDFHRAVIEYRRALALDRLDPGLRQSLAAAGGLSH